MKRVKKCVWLVFSLAMAVMLIQQRKGIARLRAENRELRQTHQNASDFVTVETLPSTNVSELDCEPAEHAELMRLRGEVSLRRQELAELRNQQERSATLPGTQVDSAPRPGSAFHAAETWRNAGYAEPQSAAITFFWALRTGDQAGYSGAFGRDMATLEDAWTDAFKAIKGSFFSKPERLPNGDVRLNVAHETIDGNLVTSLITFREQNGELHIRSMAGYPTGVLDTSSLSANLTGR